MSLDKYKVTKWRATKSLLATTLENPAELERAQLGQKFLIY
jgi:hypothetical protein